MAEYIKNKEFLRMLADYKEKRDAALEAGDPEPRVPDEIGLCFIQISTRLASRMNFSGYTYKDEMTGDALENCLNAVNNFDPARSDNPFAYFTMIAWNAFLRRIENEKKQTYIKYKALEELVISDSLSDEEGGAYANFDIENEKMKPIIEKFESKTKKKHKKEGLEKFIK